MPWDLVDDAGAAATVVPSRVSGRPEWTMSRASGSERGSRGVDCGSHGVTRVGLGLFWLASQNIRTSPPLDFVLAAKDDAS